MAKKSIVLRNKKRESLIQLHQIKRRSLVKDTKNLSLSFEDRLDAQKRLSELSRNSSQIRYRNRCGLTGRPRGNLRKFGLARMVVRDLASWGQIPGLIKSSW